MGTTELERLLESFEIRIKGKNNIRRDTTEIVKDILSRMDQFDDYHQVIFLMILLVASRIDLTEVR